MRLLVALALLVPQDDKPVKVQAVLQDSPVHYQAQLLGSMDRPVGEEINLPDNPMPARVTDKGQLELDVKNDGKPRTISKRDVISVPMKSEKGKGVTLKIEVWKDAEGEWVYRNLTVLRMAIGAEQFIVVDANGNGVYNEPRKDGMAWDGLTWLYPLPGPGERWCSATQELTGLSFGIFGEEASVRAKPLATTVAAALPVLKGVNEERAGIGLTPRPEDLKLSAELQKHCVYMAMNNLLAHPEEPGKPGYSKEGHEAGMRSILSRGTPAERVAAGMVQTYFHRQDVLRPQTLAFGVGYEGNFGGIDGRSSLGQAPANYWPVLWPVPGQTGVAPHYGKEAPDACPGDDAAGVPITAYFGARKLKLVSHSLKAVGVVAGATPAKAPPPVPGATAGPVECYLFDPQQGASADMTGYQHAVCIMAKDPLKPNTEYEVMLQVDVDGKPWTKTWRFSTSAGSGRMRRP